MCLRGCRSDPPGSRQTEYPLKEILLATAAQSAIYVSAPHLHPADVPANEGFRLLSVASDELVYENEVFTRVLRQLVSA